MLGVVGPKGAGEGAVGVALGELRYAFVERWLVYERGEET